MTIDGSGGWFPLPDGEGESTLAEGALPQRLDSILPSDNETGVADFWSLRTYLGAFMDLMGRHGQPLSLLMIAPDTGDSVRSLGVEGRKLIGAAIARCIRQETRIHDVIGRARANGSLSSPAFLLVLPLMNESSSTLFAERLRAAMTISACDEGRAWLTISVGVASLSLDTDGADALILRAQEALASAQRSGGGRVWNHSDSVRRMVEGDRPGPMQE